MSTARRVVLPVIAACLCAGCETREAPGSQAPPSAAETRPGDGQVQAETSAISTFRAWREVPACVSTSTVNRRFTPVLLKDTTGSPRRLLLTETLESVQCEDDAVSSTATLSVLAAPFDERRIGQLAWSIETRTQGRYLNEEHTAVSPAHLEAEVFCCADLYVVTDFDGLATYYSLRTGAPLYVTRDTLIRVEIPGSAFRWRFIAFHDRRASVVPPEASRDASVIGVLHYGDEQRLLERVEVVADAPIEFEVASTKLLIEGSESDYAWPLHRAALATDRRSIEGFSVVVELHESELRDGPPLATIVVPVVADELDLANARVPTGLRLRR